MKKHVHSMGPRSPWAILSVLAIAVCALALAACGSDSSTTSSSPETTTSTESGGQPSSGETVKGEPIVVANYTDINTEGSPYPNIEETAHVYQEWINTHGGIAGRPLQVNFCDSRGTPTGAAKCAREGVADEVVAEVGSFNYNGDSVVPILEAANTALIGKCCALSPLEFSSLISFPLGNQPLYGVGLVKKAVDDGCKHITAGIVEGAEAFEPLMENAATQLGTKIEKFVSIPGVPRDLSPQVAELTGNEADCLLMVVSEAPFIAWMPAFAQSGSEAKMYGPQGNFDEFVVKGFEEIVAGDVNVGMYPDISLPQWKDYRDALELFNAPPEPEGGGYNSLAGLGTWSGFEAFKQIVEGMKGPINHDTFLKAASTAKVDLPGMLPPLDLAKPWNKDGGVKGDDRVFNRCVVYSEFNDEGVLIPSGDEFEDVSELAGGTKPMDCGPPFG